MHSPVKFHYQTKAMDNIIEQLDGAKQSTQPTPSLASVVTEQASKSTATLRLGELLIAVRNLPKNEQAEFDYVKERLRFFTAKYGSSAQLAIMAAALEAGITN
jgi:hypothetical protein